MTDSYKILRVLRAMAWERVKGELQSILQTFWGEEERERYQNLYIRIEQFIDTIDDEVGL